MKNKPDSSSIFANTGNYKKLYAYQKAEAIFDITYYFCHKYLRKGDRTIDQMIQAARSGKQNIAEGSAASSTSMEMDIKLKNVAKASSLELLTDYEDYLRTREHRQWEEDSIEMKKMRELGRKHNDSAFYMELIQTRPPETIANIAICLIKQNDYMMFRMLKTLEKQFLAEGGFRERMTRMRINERDKNKKMWVSFYFTFLLQSGNRPSQHAKKQAYKNDDLIYEFHDFLLLMFYIIDAKQQENVV